MPDNFIISFDGGNGIKGDKQCNACLLISTKNKDNSITVLHEYFNKEAIHLFSIMEAFMVSGTEAAIFKNYVNVKMIIEK